MRTFLIALFLLLSNNFLFSQNTEEEIEHNNHIENQFDDIYRKSTTYQIYKVISKEKYQQLKANVLDSLKSSKDIISKKEMLLKSERSATEKTLNQLSKLKLDLEVANKKENSISIFGMQVSKISYNLTIWSIITVLLLALSYFIFKFYRSNILTKEAQNNLLDVEQEFEKHKKKSLERDQKLRRQLQDEINKQRNS